MTRDRPYGRVRQAVADLLATASSAALLVAAAVLFLAGAIGGIGVIGRLGGAGWLMYAIVIGTYALVFGPVIASAVTLRQNGSPRHRAALEKRRQQQRSFFGLSHLEADAERRAQEAGREDD